MVKYIKGVNRLILPCTMDFFVSCSDPQLTYWHGRVIGYIGRVIGLWDMSTKGDSLGWHPH